MVLQNDSNKRYFIGIGWFILSLVSSVTNDLITKYTGLRLPVYQVTFLRFLFSTLTLIPFIIYAGKDSLKSERPLIHILRGSLFFFGITIWTQGLVVAHIATATLVSFTIPLFTLVLAVFFLKEDIVWQRWVATILGFFGILIIIEPQAVDFNPWILVLILAALMFATLDIINKKYVIKETMLSMLFYSAVTTTMLALIPAIYCWISPTVEELLLFLLLGASANLILYFILKAFSIVDATAVAPYRYLELILSASFGYLLFNEVPKAATWLGAMIVIPATLFVTYSEKKRLAKK
ncbi:MAG: putative S-adenosylmethionine uptake transporter [Rickettsiaceae bacterium]|jgi:S-adenosylmethionine uptake transporter|nr:putative S-adenosylmethionine uptake transporter [Rickettsiaceae bacterium]